MADHAKILAFIAQCDDAAKLRQLLKNAYEQEADDVADAAFRKLAALVPSEQPGTVAYDFWRTVNAFELMLTVERERTTLLSRTRQKVKRDGVVKTLEDWAVSKKATPGFRMLLERGMPELTGEAIVLRHTSHFGADVTAAARRRLEAAGIDIANIRIP
ncbi:MAG TPA: hypothetical protein VN932_08420 [Rhizomicrobium sp.]|nr:hypothetical protein [Rhizomicrobium sp.]